MKNLYALKLIDLQEMKCKEKGKERETKIINVKKDVWERFNKFQQS